MARYRANTFNLRTYERSADRPAFFITRLRVGVGLTVFVDVLLEAGNKPIVVDELLTPFEYRQAVDVRLSGV